MNKKPNPSAASKTGAAISAKTEPVSGRPGGKNGGADAEATEPLIPGEILYGDGDVEINIGMPVTTIRVVNAADRPVQIGSHYHFAEVNEALEFDRKAAWGKRLNVLSGGAVRFEPGAVEEVELVPIQGRRVVLGLRGLCGGSLDE